MAEIMGHDEPVAPVAYTMRRRRVQTLSHVRRVRLRARVRQ